MSTVALPHRSGWRFAPRMGWREALSPRNIGVVYLGVLVFVWFSVRIPDLFLTEATIKSVLTEQSLGALVALGFMIPLAAGQLDLSIGPNLAASAIVIAWCTTEKGLPLPIGIAAGIAFGTAVGVVNGIMVVRFRIQAFIATLAMTSVLTAFATLVTQDNDIAVPVDSGLRTLARGDWLGLNRGVYYLVFVALVLWFVLEHTPLGRYLFASGAGPDAARLAGIQVNRYVFGSFVAGGFIGGICGLLSVSRIGVGSPNIGPGFLLPAAAAAFVGSTQFKRGQINVWGTLLATFVIAFGVKGLLLQQWDPWVEDLFYGVALAVAYAVSQFQGRARVVDDVAAPAPATEVEAPAETPLVNLVRPWLRELADRSGETAHLAVLRGDQVEFLDCAESSADLRVGSRVGSRELASATAAGRAILAELGPHELHAIDPNLATSTPNDGQAHLRGTLEQELDQVRRQGYARSVQPDEGVGAVAVPVLDGSGRVVGALSLAAPHSRLSDEAISRQVALLTDAAGRIARGDATTDAGHRPLATTGGVR